MPVIYEGVEYTHTITAPAIDIPYTIYVSPTHLLLVPFKIPRRKYHAYLPRRPFPAGTLLLEPKGPNIDFFKKDWPSLEEEVKISVENVSFGFLNREVIVQCVLEGTRLRAYWDFRMLMNRDLECQVLESEDVLRGFQIPIGDLVLAAQGAFHAPDSPYRP